MARVSSTDWKPKFFVFDTETTGLSSKKDRIIELAVVSYVPGEDISNIKPLSMLINPQRRVPEKVTKTHGITDNMLEGKPLFKEAWTSFREYVERECSAGEQPVLVAHNAEFDVKFLRAELTQSRLPFPNWDIACTLDLVRDMWPRKPSKLSDLTARFKVSEYEQHRAAGDVQGLCKVLDGIDALAKSPKDNVERKLWKQSSEFTTYGMKRSCVVSPRKTSTPPEYSTKNIFQRVLSLWTRKAATSNDQSQPPASVTAVRKEESKKGASLPNNAPVSTSASSSEQEKVTPARNVISEQTSQNLSLKSALDNVPPGNASSTRILNPPAKKMISSGSSSSSMSKDVLAAKRCLGTAEPDFKMDAFKDLSVSKLSSISISTADPVSLPNSQPKPPQAPQSAPVISPEQVRTEPDAPGHRTTSAFRTPPRPQPPSRRPTSASNSRVFVTSTGECFHVEEHCYGLRKARTTRACHKDNMRPGLRPCTICCNEPMQFGDFSPVSAGSPQSIMAGAHSSGSANYFKSPSGAKYHTTSECYGLRKARAKIPCDEIPWGLSPCSICT